MGLMRRKPQYIVSAFIMGVAMFSFGGILKLLNEGIKENKTYQLIKLAHLEEKSSWLQVLLIVCLEVGAIAYGAGVGSIPYTMAGEVFTPECKTMGICIVQSVR